MLGGLYTAFMNKVVICDVDGVLLCPKEPFSWTYARANGLDRQGFTAFFWGEFQEALIDKADLKDLITKHNHTWQWDGPVDELLEQWFETEYIPNKPLLDQINRLRTNGIACYYATNQEKYRAAYLRNRLLKRTFDGGYVSSDLRTKKPDQAFFDAVIADITTNHPDIQPHHMLFIDDTLEHIEGARVAGINAHHYTPKSAQKIMELLSSIAN